MLLFPQDKEYILKTKLARKTYGACKISFNVKKIEFLKAHSHIFLSFVYYSTFGGFSARAHIGTETVVVHWRFEFCKKYVVFITIRNQILSLKFYRNLRYIY